jgi:hypothetical protein
MDVELHNYYSDDGKRTASVHYDGQSYYVKLFTKKDLTITDEWVKDEVRYLPNKSERYAEDCAENWVLGVF